MQTTAYYSVEQSLLATIYQPVVVVALFLGIAAALREHHGPTASLVGAFFTTGIATLLHIGHGWNALGLEYPELAELAAFAWGAVPLLQERCKRSTVYITCLLLGTVAGFELLVKFNTALTIIVVALAVSLLVDWRAVGRHCATLAAFVVSLLVWWVLAGQRPGDLAAWLRSSVALMSGYSENMAAPSPLMSLVAILMLVWLVALGVLFFRRSAEVPREFVVLAVLVTAILAKKAFVRFDEWRVYPLLAFIVVAVAVAPLTGTHRRALRLVALVAVLVLVAVPEVVKLAAGYPDRVSAALQAPGQAFDRLATVSIPGQIDRRIQQAKMRQRELYGIPDSFIQTIGHQTVHIDPDQISVVWAYDLAWRPIPVMQTYSAYTPALDSLDSESLSSSGPEFVLSRLSPLSPAIGTIDGRLGVQESPRYSRSLLCNYSVTGIKDRWILFTRTGFRCGPLTPVGQVTVHGDEQVAVPPPSRPDVAVLVGIDLYPTLFARVFEGAIIPLAVPTVTVDGTSYRLTAANAAEPFLVDSPTSVDGTNLQIHAHRIGVGRAPALARDDSTVQLRFYEMTVQS